MYPRLSERRQLFINDAHVEQGRSESNYGLHNIRRVLHAPVRRGLVVEPDRPWESPVIQMLSHNVIRDAATGRLRLWYNCFIRQWYAPCNMEVESSFVLYAESDDGIHWTKPPLGLYEINGSSQNNICLMAPGCGAMWPGVLEDPREEDPARRFKLLAHGSVGPDHGIVIYFSPDGTRWTAYPHNPVMYARVDCGDSHCIMGCRDPRTGRFVATIRPVDWYLSYPIIPYYRYDRGDPQNKDKFDATCSHRRVGISFSDDFTCWSPTREVLAADLDDPPGTQMQGMTLCPYEDQYLGFVIMHYADGINDTIDIQLAVSDDLSSWQRVGQRKPFLAIGDEGPWQSRMIFAISGTPIHIGNELYLYYNTHRSTHYTGHGNRYGAIGLATLRLDGFVSMHAEGEGFVVTKPFTFRGDTLQVNADAGRGRLRVQILDERLRPVAGWLSEPLTGDDTAHVLRWPDGRSLAELEGRPVRLKFLMDDTHLYSFAIVQAGAGGAAA